MQDNSRLFEDIKNSNSELDKAAWYTGRSQRGEMLILNFCILNKSENISRSIFIPVSLHQIIQTGLSLIAGYSVRGPRNKNHCCGNRKTLGRSLQQSGDQWLKLSWVTFLCRYKWWLETRERSARDDSGRERVGYKSSLSRVVRACILHTFS